MNTDYAAISKEPQGALKKVREDQIPNSTGGFVFKIDMWAKLNRFLILGAEGGTFYVKERDLVKDNHDSLLACIKENGIRTVDEIVQISVSGRAYKNDPAIFALALCMVHGNDETKRLAADSVSKVCRIGTHLFHLARFIKALRGTGRIVRKAFGGWYQVRDADKLAYQAIKYQQRDGWTHRDILRISHPNCGANPVLTWMTGGIEAAARKTCKEQLPKLIWAFEEAKTASTKALVILIAAYDLPREAIPTDKLNEPAIWDALLLNMPLTAMIRNLGKMTSIGLLKPLSVATSHVCATLENQDALKKARIHPMAILIAAKTYASGHGLKGSLSWNPVPAILSALYSAFYRCFGNVEPTGKPLLIALDVSGSMSWDSIAGCSLTSAEAVAAFSLIHASIEPQCHIFGFANTFRELAIHKGMSLTEACNVTAHHNFGCTDVSLAVRYALQNKLSVGAFIIMTDNEVNAGVQPYQVLQQYRQSFIKDARCIVVGTTATDFTVADPSDPLSLDIAGFDAATPTLISNFVKD